MYYPHSTQVPNEILDDYLTQLNQAQLKVVLIIIRQTLGWIDQKTKQRKHKDWISISFFHRKTGLTSKSVSLAIAELIRMDLIVAMDYQEKLLKTAQDRRGKKRIYYAYAPYYWSLKHKTCVDMLTDVCTFRPNTKLTHTKEVMQHEKNVSHLRKLSDMERYEQIERQGQNPN